MNAVAIAGCSAAFEFLLWTLAARTARSRAVDIGARPVRWLLAGAAFTFVLALFAGRSAPALACATAGSLICALTDSRTGLIFDAVTATLALCAAAIACATGTFVSGLAGACCTGGALFALFAGTRGRGIGLGDVKLAAIVGLALGPLTAASAFGIAFLAGGLYGAALLATGRARRGDAVRFGPFIAGGVAAAAIGHASGLLG